MKLSIVFIVTCISSLMYAEALVINEIMSNPTGDDGGREWIELYNNTDNAVDLSTLTVSIKGGSFVPATPVAGGTIVPPHGYAIIGSTVGGATKFALDYPSYTGPLFKSSISLVNTGATSVDIKVQGTLADSLASYTAAKEGFTYALIDSTFVTGTPTPGEANIPAPSHDGDASTTPPGPQGTIPQMSPPSADITLYLPAEKIVVAGAPTVFSVYALTRAGKPIEGSTYTWSFGDGGSRVGATTTYRYFYPGRYIAQVEGGNGFIAGTARMIIKVVSPDIGLSSIIFGKYGPFIDINNPNMYDLDISDWKLSIDGALFSFPKNTLLSQGVTHFSGASMGFASTTVSSSTIIKLLFPSMDEVVRVLQGGELIEDHTISTTLTQKIVPTTSTLVAQSKLFLKSPQRKIPSDVQFSSTSSSVPQATTSESNGYQNKKDTRIASFIKSLFRH